jgi:hypothetical protein
VLADHTRPIEDLHHFLILFSSRAWNSLDSELWWSGDVDAVQQIPQSASGDQSFIFDGLYLVSLTVHLLLLRVAQRSVVLIIFIFSIVAFFFLNLIVFFLLLMIVVIVVVVDVVIVMVIDVAIVLRQLLSFFRCFLSIFSRRYHDHDLKGILHLRNVLRRVVAPVEVAHLLVPSNQRADV